MKLKKLAWKAYCAELVGTFSLCTAVLFSANWPIMTPLAAALTVGMFVYTIGAISGAHLNPAVTLSLFSLDKMRRRDVLGYLVAQCLAAAGAALLAANTLQSAVPAFEDSWSASWGELLGAFFLVFGISAVVYKKVSDAASGIVIGGSLLLGILMSSFWSLGVLNPAVSLSLGIYSPVYFLAPVVGGIAGAHLYRFLQK